MSPQRSSKSVVVNEPVTQGTCSVYEVIVSTCDGMGKPNAAPMGIRFLREHSDRREELILVRPYKSTTTYRNLSSQGEAVVNVTSDPELFCRTALKVEFKSEQASKTLFCASKKVKPPRIKGCDAYFEVSVVNVKDTGDGNKDISEVLCDVTVAEVANPLARMYCRAPHALIEATIHATRVGELVSQGMAGEAYELVKLIDHYAKLVHRVAPDSRYEAIAQEIGGMVKRIIEGK